MQPMNCCNPDSLRWRTAWVLVETWKEKSSVCFHVKHTEVPWLHCLCVCVCVCFHLTPRCNSAMERGQPHVIFGVDTCPCRAETQHGKHGKDVTSRLQSTLEISSQLQETPAFHFHQLTWALDASIRWLLSPENDEAYWGRQSGR